MASVSVNKGLQTSINRFFGVTLGAPLVVDGKIGPATLAAINGIVQWMSEAGFDTTFIANLTGAGWSASGWGAPVFADVSLNAEVLSNALDTLATEHEFETGVVPGGGTPKPPTVAMVQTPAGKRPSIPAESLPKGPSQKATAGLLGLGLPDWAVYTGGLGLVAVIGLMIAKRKGPGSVAVAGTKQNAYGLSFSRWWRAAGFTSAPGVSSKARDAWNRGEDPSDWRAERQYAR